MRRLNNQQFQHRGKSFWLEGAKISLQSALQHRSKKVRAMAQRFAEEHPRGYFWATIGEHDERMAIGFKAPAINDFRQSFTYEMCLYPII